MVATRVSLATFQPLVHFPIIPKGKGNIRIARFLPEGLGLQGFRAWSTRKWRRRRFLENRSDFLEKNIFRNAIKIFWYIWVLCWKEKQHPFWGQFCAILIFTYFVMFCGYWGRIFEYSSPWSLALGCGLYRVMGDRSKGGTDQCFSTPVNVLNRHVTSLIFFGGVTPLRGVHLHTRGEKWSISTRFRRRRRREKFLSTFL